MKKSVLTLTLVAAAALVGCSNSDKPAPKTAPAAAAKAAPQPAKVYPSVYENAELAPLAKAFEASMVAIAQFTAERTSPVTEQETAAFTEHEQHRQALLSKIKDQYAQAAALREVHQHAFRSGGGQQRRAYQLNVRRIREAAMMARAQARRSQQPVQAANEQRQRASQAAPAQQAR